MWRPPVPVRYLGFALVVERQDIIPAARLALAHQEHPVSLRPRALDQICCLDPGDGPVEPGVGEEEVIGLLDHLLWHGEGGRAWRGGDQRDRLSWAPPRWGRFLCSLLSSLTLTAEFCASSLTGRSADIRGGGEGLQIRAA